MVLSWKPLLVVLLLQAAIAAVATNGNWGFQFDSLGATSGVLRARPNSSAPWGIVCDDGFNANSAAAACRSLGLSTTNPSFRQSTTSELLATSVGSSTLIYMDDVYCSSTTAPYLPQCTFLFSDAGRKTHNCEVAEAVFVFCPDGSTATTTAAATTAPATTAAPSSWQVSLVGTGASASPVYSGLLRVRPNAASAWGIVCDDDFGAVEAAAACRSIFGSSFSSGTTRTSTSAELVGYDTATIYMDNVNCANTSTQLLPECTFIESTPTVRRHDCQAAEAVFISCTPPSSTAVLPPRNWQVSLAGGGYEGLLRVRPDSTSAWGTVCDDDFGTLEAGAACRSIFGSAFSSATARTSTSTEQVGYATATIYMDDVRCSRTTGQTLPSCTFIESTPSFRRHNCQSNESVYLSCASEQTSSFSSSVGSSATRTVNVGAIIGGVVGGGIGLCAMIMLITMCARARRNAMLGNAMIAPTGASSDPKTSAGALFAHSNPNHTTAAASPAGNGNVFAYNPHGGAMGGPSSMPVLTVPHAPYYNPGLGYVSPAAGGPPMEYVPASTGYHMSYTGGGGGSGGNPMPPTMMMHAPPPQQPSPLFGGGGSGAAGGSQGFGGNLYGPPSGV